MAMATLVELAPTGASSSSMRIEASLTVDVPEGDDYSVLADKAQSELRKLLEDTYRLQRRDHGAQ